MLLVSAVAVATSPAWLNAVGAWWGVEMDAQELPFSMYWIALPGALAVGVSWVFEMGGDPLRNAAPTGGFDWTKKEPDQRDRRGSSDGKPKPVGPVSVWRRLEMDFREILQFGADLNATWERTSGYSEASESWRVSGDFKDARTQKKFSELTETAGRMLVEWTGYTPPLAPSTARQVSGQNRWFCALRDREIKTETWAPGQVMQAESVTGHVHGGMIRGVIEASVELCVQLTLEESLEERPHATIGPLGRRIIDPSKA